MKRLSSMRSEIFKLKDSPVWAGYELATFGALASMLPICQPNRQINPLFYKRRNTIVRRRGVADKRPDFQLGGPGSVLLSSVLYRLWRWPWHSWNHTFRNPALVVLSNVVVHTSLLVVSGGDPDIIVTTRSGSPALVLCLMFLLHTSVLCCLWRWPWHSCDHTFRELCPCAPV